jgi:uncharacterized protein (DUF3084 family)
MPQDLSLLKRNDAATQAAINVLSRQVHELMEVMKVVARQQATLEGQFRALQDQLLHMQAAKMGTGPTMVINPKG